ncbi:MAG TPA: OmpA family protein, partial [Gemmatimonadales bacterium]
RGATVDALGCPSDSDGDGVLDGIDQCPNTPPGTPVDATGCPIRPGAPAPKPPPAAPPTPSQAAPPQPPPRVEARRAEPPKEAPKPAGAPVSRFVLRDNAFAAGSARLRPNANATLDSVVAALRVDPTLRLEIGAHTAPSRSEVDSRGFASLRVEAVRSYLLAKGVSPQRLSPKVYGATQLLTADTSATGRSINRRIEIVPLP